MDATAIAALQTQLRLLIATLERLGAARRDLVPAAATFWNGPAREAYDRAVRDVDGEMGEILDLVALAQQSTALALSEELRRG